ncbi:YgaP-like transmembrane domain [Lysinibacillus sp. FJAT-14222]|uniref:YgaP-like transmembrane domain n=1 Tax=Lysinibacillus sp. FJAT-14222 TaxID=1932366 RepID=UPI0006AE0097|nr:YgaP-like transmembrane domain [Lysinibacillus sp. FJAT-14222]
MMQETNLSEQNAFCRFAMGTSLTAFGIARVSRNPNCMRGRLMIAFGAMKMAEGIFKYCPTKALLSSNMQSAMNSNNNNTSMQSMLSGQNSMSSEQIDKLMKDFSSAISGTMSGSNATASKQSDSSTSNQNSSDSKNSANQAQNPS